MAGLFVSLLLQPIVLYADKISFIDVPRRSYLFLYMDWDICSVGTINAFFYYLFVNKQA